MRHFVWSMDPVLLRLGGVEIRYYGVLLVTAIGVGFGIWYRRARAHGEDRGFAEAWLWWSAPAVLIGGRLGEFLFYRTRDFFSDPWNSLRTAAGFSSHGVTAALLITSWAFSRRYKRSLRLVSDYCAPGLAVGTCCIRLGNFFNSEIVGQPTDVRWAVVFSRVDLVPRHPVQFYEIGAALVALAAIRIAERRDRRVVGTGLSIGLFLGTYFCLRFIAEFFKERMTEQLRDPGGPLAALERILGVTLTTGQWLSIVPAIVGIVMIIGGTRRLAAMAPG